MTSIEEAIELISQLPKRYELNNQHIEYCDRKMQDLLHKIEFTDFNAFEGYKLAKELQDIRRLRRKYKDENKETKPVCDKLKKYENITNDLHSALVNIRKIKGSMENRQYQERATTSMEIALKEGMKKHE